MNGTIRPVVYHGGVGTPVGLTVFKTAGGSLGAVPDGFDSHTPLPGMIYIELCAVILPIGLADSAKLCFPFSPAKLCFLFSSPKKLIFNRITGLLDAV